MLWGIIYVCAPYIAEYYQNLNLIVYIRILGIELPIASIYTIFYAIVSKRMEFEKLFLSTMGSSLLSGLIGILMALHGFGIWALIGRELLGQMFAAIILGSLVHWHPSLVFSWSSAVRHFSYSVKITTASLLNTLVAQFRTLSIGKIYTSVDLAFYEQGQKYPEILATNITGSLDTVMFPVISDRAVDMRRVSDLILRSVKLSSFIVVPVMIGFAAVSKTIVQIFLTDVWLPCVPYMRIVSLINVFLPINSINYQAVKAIGRSGTFLRMQIIKMGINMILLMLALPHGVFAVALSGLISTIPTCIINTYPSWKYIGCGLLSQLKAMFPAVAYTIPMAVVVLAIPSFYQRSQIFLLVLQVFFGVVIYIAVAAVFHSDSLFYLVGKIKRIRRKKGA